MYQYLDLEIYRDLESQLGFGIKVEGPVPVRVMILIDEILPCLS
jgi:hypothetical protein